MTSLRERLQAGDPARTARPLDAGEVAVMRRAMASARVQSRRWPIVAGLALAATGLAAVALLVLWREQPPTSAPMPRPAAPVSAAPVVPVPALPHPVVTEVRSPRPRRAVSPPAPPPGATQVKEIRFITASGTQILWTVRSSEEGA